MFASVLCLYGHFFSYMYVFFFPNLLVPIFSCNDRMALERTIALPIHEEGHCQARSIDSSSTVLGWGSRATVRWGAGMLFGSLPLMIEHGLVHASTTGRLASKLRVGKW